MIALLLAGGTGCIFLLGALVAYVVGSRKKEGAANPLLPPFPTSPSVQSTYVIPRTSPEEEGSSTKHVSSCGHDHGQNVFHVVGTGLGAGAVVALALTRMWPGGMGKLGANSDWRMGVAGGGMALGGALLILGAEALSAWARQRQQRQGGGESGGGRGGETGKSTLRAGALGVCLHAVPAGISLYVVALESISSAVVLAVAIAAHTGLLGFAVTLPAVSHKASILPVSSSPSASSSSSCCRLSLGDAGLLLISALSNVIGVLLGMSFPSSISHDAFFQGLCLTAASGVLSAMAFTHLLPPLGPPGLRIALISGICVATLLQALG